MAADFEALKQLGCASCRLLILHSLFVLMPSGGGEGGLQHGQLFGSQLTFSGVMVCRACVMLCPLLDVDNIVEAC